MEFSSNLAKIRKSKNLSRQQIADILGITVTAYANYENGNREPSLSMLREIAITLNTPSDELLAINVSQPNSYFYDEGIKILAALNYEKIDNPFDFLGRADFSLYFAKRGNSILESLIPFRESDFIELVKSAKQSYPNFKLDEARKTAITRYIDQFLNKSDIYSQWLQDLDTLKSFNRTKENPAYTIAQERAELLKKILLKHNIIPDEFDQVILLKISMDIRPATKQL